jgi:hypothetical protein
VKHALLLALLVVTGGACVQLLGDDFTIGEGGAGGTTSSSSSSMGGMGGVGPLGGGGIGGAEGGSGPCQLGTSQGCPAGEKCTLRGTDNDVVTCIAAGNSGPATLCAADTECTVGTFCDPFTGICETICTEPGAQSVCGLGWCVGTGVPGYGLCTIGCDPTNIQGCPDSNLTCGWWGPTEGGESTFHCAINPDGIGVTKMVGEPCTLIGMIPVLHSCGPGKVCVDNQQGGGTCLGWCAPAGTPGGCPGQQQCVAFPLALIQDGIEYGACL